MNQAPQFMRQSVWNVWQVADDIIELFTLADPASEFTLE